MTPGSSILPKKWDTITVPWNTLLLALQAVSAAAAYRTMASTEKKVAAHTAALYSSVCPRAESGFLPSGVGSEGYAVDAATGRLQRRLTSAAIHIDQATRREGDV